MHTPSACTASECWNFLHKRLFILFEKKNDFFFQIKILLSQELFSTQTGRKRKVCICEQNVIFGTRTATTLNVNNLNEKRTTATASATQFFCCTSIWLMKYANDFNAWLIVWLRSIYFRRQCICCLPLLLLLVLFLLLLLFCRFI